MVPVETAESGIGGTYASIQATYVTSAKGNTFSIPFDYGAATLNVQFTQEAYGKDTIYPNAWNSYRISNIKFTAKINLQEDLLGGWGVTKAQSIYWGTTGWGNWGTTGWGNYDGTTTVVGNWYTAPLQPKERWKIQIRKNLEPVLESRNRTLMYHNNNQAELRARLLLRDLVGDEEFKRYLVRGFIVVKGKTGIIYKVPGGHERIVSYVKNKEGKYKPFEAFCIVFKKESLPHTDAVVMRKLLLESDEFELRKLANVSQAPEAKSRFDGILFKPVPLLKVAV